MTPVRLVYMLLHHHHPHRRDKSLVCGLLCLSAPPTRASPVHVAKSPRDQTPFPLFLSQEKCPGRCCACVPGPFLPWCQPGEITTSQKCSYTSESILHQRQFHPPFRASMPAMAKIARQSTMQLIQPSRTSSPITPRTRPPATRAATNTRVAFLLSVLIVMAERAERQEVRQMH